MRGRQGNWCTLTHFKTIPVAYTANHQIFTPFKTPVNHNQIDSFQDPMFICSTKLFKLTPFKTPALDCMVFPISIGDTLQTDSVKISMGNYLQLIGYFRTILHSEFQTHFKTPVNHTSHSVNGLISRPFRRGKEDRAHGSSFSDFLDSFQDPTLEIKEKTQTTQQIIHHHHCTTEGM